MARQKKIYLEESDIGLKQKSNWQKWVLINLMW